MRENKIADTIAYNKEKKKQPPKYKNTPRGNGLTEMTRYPMTTERQAAIESWNNFTWGGALR